MLTKTTFADYNVEKFLGVPIHVVCTCSYFVQFLYVAVLACNPACQAAHRSALSIIAV